jgi:hypothetical protein
MAGTREAIDGHVAAENAVDRENVRYERSAAFLRKGDVCAKDTIDTSQAT